MADPREDETHSESPPCPDCGAVPAARESFCSSCGAFLAWETAMPPPKAAPVPPEQERSGGEPAQTATSADVAGWVIDVTTSVSANAAWVLVGYGARQAWARLRARVRRDHTTGTPTREEAERAALARVTLADKNLHRRDLTIHTVTVPGQGPAVVVVLHHARGNGRHESVEFTVEVIKRAGLIEARIQSTRISLR
jgi:hypothetical protein